MPATKKGAPLWGAAPLRGGLKSSSGAPVFYPPCGTYHEMQGFPDQLLIGLVIATLPLSLAA